MRVVGKIVVALVVLCLIGVGGLLALSWKSAIPKLDTPPKDFPRAQVNAGERLATAGNCVACHTAPTGKPYAGGLPIETTFGTIYTSNITPDPNAGIGSWNLDAFTRAMREGVSRGGQQLYPAFPYDHYTRLKDEDIAAIYAYLMTREPVPDHPPRTSLRFPYNMRALLAGWKLLYLDRHTFQPDQAKGDEWNRGAYLVEALAHCGSCHTPRNDLGGEIASAQFNGGNTGGWWAPPLNASSPALVPWTKDSLYDYLRTWTADHGGAIGPMGEVTASLQRLPDADVSAIAAYIADGMKGAKDRSADLKAIETRAFDAGGNASVQNGQRIYEGACAQCHESGGAVPFTTRSLAQHTILQGPDPANALNVILHGIAPPEGAAGAIMPAFGNVLDDNQTADLLAYLRKRFTNEPPWPDPTKAIADARGQEKPRSAVMR